jgi:hypothetical protein
MRSIPDLQNHLFADDVIAGVEIFDVPGECGCAVADQEGRKVTIDPR